MSDCIFCKIVAGEVGARIFHQDERVIAFADIAPQAPVHALVIPRRHVADVEELGPADLDLVGHMVLTARKVAADLGVGASGYRLVFNSGPDSGQLVSHLHLHLLGGKKLDGKMG